MNHLTQLILLSAVALQSVTAQSSATFAPCPNTLPNDYLSSSNNTVTLNTYPLSAYTNTYTCPASTVAPLSTVTLPLSATCVTSGSNSYSISYVQSNCNQPASLILTTNCANALNTTYTAIYTFSPPNNQVDFDLTTQSCTGSSVLQGSTPVYYVIDFPPTAKTQSVAQQANQTTTTTSKVQTSSGVQQSTVLYSMIAAAGTALMAWI